MSLAPVSESKGSLSRGRSSVRACGARWARKGAAPLLLLVFVAGTAGTFWHLHWKADRLYEEMALQAASIEAVTLKEFRGVYSAQVVNRIERHGIEAAHDYAGKDRAIPLPATLTMELGERINASRPGAHVRLYSDYPFPWRTDGGPQDDFEREALRILRQRPEQPFYRFEAFQERPSLRYAVADTMEASCVACHNSRRDSPKTDWQVGDVRGVLEIIRPLDSAVASSHAAQRRGLFVALAATSLGLAGLGLVYFRLQRTAASLGKSESQTRSILESALDCIITIDHQGKVLEWNPAAEKTFGYRRAQALGQRLRDLIVPQDLREAHDRGLRHYLATGEGPVLGKRIEINALRADGTEFPVELAICVSWPGGPPLFTAYLRDLSEHKRAEAERETLIAQLEAKNAELERFTYTVSHDLKSPLLTIKGFLGMLEKDALSGNVEAMKDDLAEIAAAADKMKRLLDDLLELSRIGRAANPSQDLALSDLAHEAVQLLATPLRERGVQLDIAPNLPAVLGDRTRLLEVLQNLVENAVKFLGDQPEPRIEIGARSDEAQAVCFVRDNGIGIDPRYHDKVFGLFEQLNPHAGGTGIGLALVKRIIEVHGGRIWVESDGPGTGATFYFTLPPPNGAPNGEEPADGR